MQCSAVQFISTLVYHVMGGREDNYHSTACTPASIASFHDFLFLVWHKPPYQIRSYHIILKFSWQIKNSNFFSLERARCRTVLPCTVQYCTVLYCTVLYRIVLYCTVLCTVCMGSATVISAFNRWIFLIKDTLKYEWLTTIDACKKE